MADERIDDIDKAWDAAHKENAEREEKEGKDKADKSSAKKGGNVLGGVAKATAATTATMTAAAGMAVNAAKGGTGIIRNVDKGNLFLVIAIVIAIFDVILPPAYRGFQFSFTDILEINVLSVIFSSFFITLFVLYVGKKILKKEMSFIVLIILYFVIQKTGILVYRFSISSLYITIFFALLIGMMAVVWFMRRSISILSEEDIAYLIFIFVLSYFLLQIGWQGNLKAIAHFSFILIFGIVYMKKIEAGSYKRYYHMIAMWFIDFYGYGLLSQLSGVSVGGLQIFDVVPLLTIYVGIYLYTKADNRLAAWFVVGLWLLLVFLNPTIAHGSTSEQQEFKEVQGKGLREISKGFSDSIQNWIDARLELATGGLYRGAVEKNKYEPLGVYIENVRTLQPRFYIDEPITVWGTIKSKTLSDAVIVNFNCNRWNKDNERLKADIVSPTEPIMIFSLEEQDFNCEFKPSTFEPGTQILTMIANYNFKTDAYQKVYFIDRDKYRQMIREEIEPFTQYGITDKTPTTIFTNGPVEIGMDITPLITVSSDASGAPINFLGITVKNRGSVIGEKGDVIGTYEGTIRNIKELVVLVPESMNIDAASCRPLPFKDYEKKDCEKSCANEENSCKAACGKNKICSDFCIDSKSKCEKDCIFLFEGEGDVKYKGYQLDVEQMKIKGDEYKNIDRYKTFACKIAPMPGILGSTPITTRYIRARARYNYTLEKSVSITVEQAPGTISGIATGLIDTSITDNDLKAGIEPSLIKAIAIIESGVRHCEDGSLSCTPDKVIKNSCCVGMMQINVDGRDGTPKWKFDASDICGKDEKGDPKTVYDADCNIKLGIKKLKDSYNDRGKEGKVYTHSCTHLSFQTQYSGWDAALRGYNGWGCPAETSTCNANCLAAKTCDNTCTSTLNYVHIVRETQDKLRTGVVDSTLQRRLQNVENLIPKLEGEDGLKEE